MARWVLHVDMDQFIAAVEVLRRPELAGLPVIVGGRGDPTERGVVSTASYEAREFGVRSGMPLKTAVRKCPDAVLLPVDKPAYDEASAVVMDTLRAIPGAVVEVLGWDEAFVGIETDDPEAVARTIQADVLAGDQAALLRRHRRHQGAGEDRHRVRQATGDVPPDPGQLVRGDGPPADQGALGHRQPDLRAPGRPRHRDRPPAGPRLLTSRSIEEFGPSTGPHIGRLGRGVSSATVDDTPWVARAHGRETTYQQNLETPDDVAASIHVLAAQVVEDIRQEGRACARVHLKVRFAPFFTVNRSRKLTEPTFDPAVIAGTALDLFARLEDTRPIRLLGLRAEMVPPEGGYDPPRTHGRRGNP